MQAERWAQHFGTILFPWNIETGAATVYSWKQICSAVQKWRIAAKTDQNISSKLWLLNSLACNLKVCPRSNRVVNLYRFRDSEVLPDKFQTESKNTPTDSKEREIAVNAQQMINFIRLRNHAGHPSKMKQRTDAHLMSIEDTYAKTYPCTKIRTRKPPKG